MENNKWMKKIRDNTSRKMPTEDSKTECSMLKDQWSFWICGYTKDLYETGWLGSQKTPNVLMEELEETIHLQ